VLCAFAALCMAQLAVPASMIVKRERALRDGAVFRFRTRPVDPYDAFRGRYVALDFDQSRVRCPGSPSFRRGQRLYATLEEGADGFARITALKQRRPKDGPYIVVRGRSSSGDEVWIRLPFDRFYMNEELAPEAERAYQRHSGREKHDACAVVHVRNGFAVLADLQIDGLPIAEYVRRSSAPK